MCRLFQATPAVRGLCSSACWAEGPCDPGHIEGCRTSSPAPREKTVNTQQTQALRHSRWRCFCCCCCCFGPRAVFSGPTMSSMFVITVSSGLVCKPAGILDVMMWAEGPIATHFSVHRCFLFSVFFLYISWGSNSTYYMALTAHWNNETIFMQEKITRRFLVDTFLRGRPIGMHMSVAMLSGFWWRNFMAANGFEIA